MSEIKKRIFNRIEFNELIFEDEKLEEILKGIPVKTEITQDRAIVEYIPVKNSRFYIDVWNCTPRFAERIHFGKDQMKSEIIELKNKKSQELFDKLVQLRDVIINMSGHYYIETLKQKRHLDKIIVSEGLLHCKGLEECDTFLDGECPLSKRCPEWKEE